MKKSWVTWLDVKSKEGLMGSGGGRKTFFRFDNVFSSRRRLSIPVWPKISAWKTKRRQRSKGD